jgi:capsid protein
MNAIQKKILGWVGLSYLVDAANWQQRWQRPLELQTVNTIGQEVNISDWLVLLSDSRKLYANLGPAKGAIDDKATFSIGRAWNAKSGAKNREWAKKAEEWVNEMWYPMADARGGMFDFKTDLFLSSVSVDRDGEIYLLLTESPDGWPLIQLLPAHMIGMRDSMKETVESGPYRGLSIKQGIIFNEVGRAVAYNVLGATPDDDKVYSARDLIQIFDPSWADQVRGFPCFMHALLDLKDLRTVQGYEKIAAMLMSSIGLIEHNELGAPDPTDPANMLTKQKNLLGPSFIPEITSQTSTGVTTRFFRSGSGSKLEQLKSDRPGDAVSAFMDRLIRNACTGAGWPFELTWDSSKLGGANVRLLVARAERTVQDRQDLLRPIARRVVGYAVAKAIKLGYLEPDEDWYKWGFSLPARMTTDYGRDAKADLADFQAGLTTLTQILEEQGIDLDAFIAERQAEIQKLKEAGIEMPKAQAPQLQVRSSDDDEEKPDDEERRVVPMR